MTPEQKAAYDAYYNIGLYNVLGLSAERRKLLDDAFEKARARAIAAFGYDPLSRPLTAKDFDV